MSDALGHAYLAKAAMLYLMHADLSVMDSFGPAQFEQLKIKRVALDQTCPLGGYSAAHWYRHAKAATTGGGGTPPRDQSCIVMARRMLTSQSALATWALISYLTMKFSLPPVLRSVSVSPLMLAAMFGLIPNVQDFLNDGGDINAQVTIGFETHDALSMAIKQGHVDTANYLLDAGADTSSSTALSWAIKRNELALVKRILAHETRQTDTKTLKRPWTPPELGYALFRATRSGWTEMVTLILRDRRMFGDIVNTPVVGETYLHHAVRCGRKDMVAAILDAGADIHARNEWPNTPLECVEWRDWEAVLQLLVARGAAIN
jgi:ankyrin repeat protein